MLDNMKFAIWGCGIKGKMLLSCIDVSRVKVFIDNNPKLQGETYKGIKIISFSQYLMEYSDCFIIISTAIWSNEIIALLKKNKINQYFELLRCPTELPAYGERLPFSEMLSRSNPLTKDQVIVLIGLNLFTILLFDYLKEVGYETIYIADIPKEKLLSNEIKKRYAEYKFIDLGVAKEKRARCFVVDRFIDAYYGKEFWDYEKLYRFTFLSKYRYSKMDGLKNTYAGKRCFVVGNGPSLQMQDLEKLHLHHEYSFGVNYVCRAFSSTGWRPSFYFWSDAGITEQVVAMIHELDVPLKFIGNRNNGIVSEIKDNNVYYYPSLAEYYQNEGPGFTEDVNEAVYYGYTVLYDCLQFAAYMGFQKIYIIGADCEYQHRGTNEDYFINNYLPNEFSASIVENLTPNVDKADTLGMDKVFIAYRKAREYAERKGMKIYNATRGGKLEIFERVDFDSLF